MPPIIPETTPVIGANYQFSNSELERIKFILDHYKQLAAMSEVSIKVIDADINTINNILAARNSRG